MGNLTNILYAVGTAGNLGVWNGTGWKDLGNPGGWNISSFTYDAKGQIWCVGAEGNVGIYDLQNNKMEDRGTLGGWKLWTLAFDNNGVMYGLNQSGNVGLWQDEIGTWKNLGDMGGHKLLDITFDQNGEMWGVLQNGKVAKWTGSSWGNPQNIGDWNMLTIAFEKNGDMWCVGGENNVGKYINGKWTYVGDLGTWLIQRLCFYYPVEIVKVDYHFPQQVITNGNVEVGASTTYKNDSSEGQQEKFSTEKSITSQRTFTWDNASTVSASMEFKLSVPVIDLGGKVTMSASDTFEFGESNTNTKSTGFTWSATVNVPPHSNTTAIAQIGKGTITVPFTAYVSFRGKQIAHQGLFTGDNYFNSTVEVQSKPINP